MSIVQEIESVGYRARADRRFQSGRVVDVDPVTRLAIVDVGATLPDGSQVYLHSIPYSPQQPAKLGDSVVINYTNSSPNSGAIGGMNVGANSPDQTFGNGGVTGIHKVGSVAIIGDVAVSAGSGIVLTQTGQDIDIAATATALTPATSVTDVGAAGVVGTSLNYARQDHVHKGVHSLAKHAGTQLFGDVTLAEGSNVTLGVAGNEITINSSGGPTPAASVTDVASAGVVGTSTNYARQDHVHKGVHSVAKSGSAQLFGDVTLTATGGIVLNQVSNNIAIDGSGVGGGAGVGGLLSPGVSAVLSGQFWTVQYTGSPGSSQTFNLPATLASIPGGFTGSITALIINDTDNLLVVTFSVIGDSSEDGNGSITLQPGQRRVFTTIYNGGNGKWMQMGYTPEIPANTEPFGRTLVYADRGCAIEYTGSGLATFTIPNNASVPFPIGTTIEFTNITTFTVVINGAGSVTIHSRGGLTNLNGQYATARARKSATNTWYLSGDLA